MKVHIKKHLNTYNNTLKNLDDTESGKVHIQRSRMTDYSQFDNAAKRYIIVWSVDQDNPLHHFGCQLHIRG